MNYIDQIKECIYYYEINRGKRPDVLFVSNPLFCRLSSDNLLVCYDSEQILFSFCGIPVKCYYSLNQEFYLSEQGYLFEEDCNG